MLEAAVLGLVEGLTEFLPVSSTAHILLLGELLGFESNGKTFEVVIQLGAVLALLAVYAAKLFGIARRIPTDPAAQRFVIGVLIAFIPAAILGVLLRGFIKGVLFNAPIVYCSTLILGGIVLIWIDRKPLKAVYHDATAFPLPLYFKIGLFQCLALIPGMSRSGSTIVGALLMGADKRAAAEFSFFLALPTMAGAFAYDLLKSYSLLSASDFGLIAIGFVFAFLAALAVVRTLLDIVSTYGYEPFGWWRIAVGAAGLIGLAIFR